MNKHLLVIMLGFGCMNVFTDVDTIKFDKYLTCTDNLHLRLNSETYEGEFHHKTLNDYNFGWLPINNPKQQGQKIEVNDTYIVWYGPVKSSTFLNRTNLKLKMNGPKAGKQDQIQFSYSYQCRKSSKVEVEDLMKEFMNKLKERQQI